MWRFESATRISEGEGNRSEESAFDVFYNDDTRKEFDDATQAILDEIAARGYEIKVIPPEESMTGQWYVQVYLAKSYGNPTGKFGDSPVAAATRLARLLKGSSYPKPNMDRGKSEQES